MRRSYAFSAGIFGIQRPEKPLRAGEPVIRLVQRQNDLGGFADDPLPRNHAKITGIEAIIAIVPHHEVIALTIAHQSLKVRWP